MARKFRNGLLMDLFFLLSLAACSASPTTFGMETGFVPLGPATLEAIWQGDPNLSSHLNPPAQDDCIPQSCPPGQVFDTALCRCVTVSTCGDGVCGSGETRKNCPQDCSAQVPTVYCGNGACDGNENSSTCPQDCAAPSYCGDGMCDLLTESPTYCPKDCSASVCGNAICETDFSEDAVNCPADCLCGNGKCDTQMETRDNCPRDCYAECGNGSCQTVIGENNKVCPADCRTVCGDRICDLVYGESDADCPIDCDPNCDPYSEKYKETSGLNPLRCSVCGNGACETLQGETNANCAADCQAVCGDFRCDLNMGETNPNCPKDCALSCGNGGCERDKENVLTCPADCPMTAVNCKDAACAPGEAVVCRECLGDGICDFGEEKVSSGFASDCQKPQPRPCTGSAAPLALIGILVFWGKRRAK